MRRFSKFFSTGFLQTTFCPQNAPSSRCYSMWPPYYVKPVYNKSELNELIKSGEKEKLSSVPIKSAKSEETCSVFYDPDIRQFTNYVMRKGRKDLARSLVEDAFKNIKRIQLKKYYNAATDEEREKIELNPRNIFHAAITNCKPVLQLTGIKRGGATYQVPIPCSDKRSRFLAMNWMIEATNSAQKPMHFHEILARELIDAANNTGKVVKRKTDLHRQCEANRAYAHYRWG